MTQTSPELFILTLFKITGNEIGAEGGRAIAETLKTNTSLTQLDLELTQITLTLFILTFSSHRELDWS